MPFPTRSEAEPAAGETSGRVSAPIALPPICAARYSLADAVERAEYLQSAKEQGLQLTAEDLIASLFDGELSPAPSEDEGGLASTAEGSETNPHLGQPTSESENGTEAETPRSDNPNAARNRKRRLKRNQAGRPVSKRMRKAKVGQCADPVSSAFSLEDAPSSKPGYAGVSENQGGSRFRFTNPAPAPETPEAHVATLVAAEYTLIRCESNLDQPFTDCEGRVIAAMLGVPKDWEPLVKKAGSLFRKLHGRLSAKAMGKSKRRGGFPSAWNGFSFGGGQTQPSNFSRSPSDDEAWEEFLAHPIIKRLMKYIAGPWKTWFPEIFGLYSACQQDLIVRNQMLHVICKKLPFAAMTANLGPQTISKYHRDSANFVYGLCGLTAFGNFDPCKGGHLILHEPGWIIELPPGRPFLFPSSCITHENTAIGPGETRYSITWYSAGALFRWREQGYQTAKEWQAADPASKAVHDSSGLDRRRKGLASFKTIAELEQHWWEPRQDTF